MPTKEKTKRGRQRQLKEPAQWKLIEEAITHDTLTEPEAFFWDYLRVNYPWAAARMNRSNKPYEGTGFRSDFTMEVTHPWYEGIVVEIQGGIFSRHKSGHSSPAGLIRDYEKANCAQLNRWFIVQVAPREDLLSNAAKLVVELDNRFREEDQENLRMLNEWTDEPA